MSAEWVRGLWGAATQAEEEHDASMEGERARDADGATAADAGDEGRQREERGGPAPLGRDTEAHDGANGDVSTSGAARGACADASGLPPRARLLAAALVADSVASTASIFDPLHEDDTDFDTRALRRQTLTDFDRELTAAMPGRAFKDVEVLQSLPKLSRSFGMNVTAMWTASDHMVDGETYLGSMSAIHNFYFQARALEGAVSAVAAGAAPDRKQSKEIMNKLTLTYVRPDGAAAAGAANAGAGN